ncbi:hypothetical protein HRbin26_00829 [bacterium HR26]|nr:hypothetical protein HRbin26_00829 [bacterium HR26]
MDRVGGAHPPQVQLGLDPRRWRRRDRHRAGGPRLGSAGNLAQQAQRLAHPESPHLDLGLVAVVQRHQLALQPERGHLHLVAHPNRIRLDHRPAAPGCRPHAPARRLQRLRGLLDLDRLGALLPRRLAAEVPEQLAGLGQLDLDLGQRLLARPAPLQLRLAQQLLSLPAQSFGLGPGSARLLELSLSRLAASPDLDQQLFCPLGGRVEVTPGLLDHRLVEAQAPRDDQRIRLPRHAGDQPVGGYERLQVELHARVLQPGHGVGERLQLGVVSGHHAKDAQFEETGEDRPGQRRALLGIGAGRQLVEQYQAVGVGAAQRGHDPGHVGGERRETLLDALLVADVGEDGREDAQP